METLPSFKGNSSFTTMSLSSSKIKANGTNHHHEVVNDQHDDDDDGDNCMIYHRSEVFPETHSSVIISDKSVCVDDDDNDENESDIGHHHHHHHNKHHPQHEPVNIADIIKDRETAYKIEEQIEEITTSTIGPDDDVDEDGECIKSAGGGGGTDSVDSGESERRRPTVDSILDPYGLDLSSKGCARVAFPEFGLDIMDLHYAVKDYNDQDNDDQHHDNLDDDENQANDKFNEIRDNGKVKVVDAFSWEENWLFQKKRKSETDVVPIYCLLNLSESTDPVCLLIPNPSQFVPPQIGSISIDQLSDLTERNSVGSLEFSSSEDEDEDDNLNEQQGETVNQRNDSINLKSNIVINKQSTVNLSSAPSSSLSSSPFPASSLSSSSYTVNNNKKHLQQHHQQQQQPSTVKSNLNKFITANQHASSSTPSSCLSSSSPLPPLQIPEFIPSNTRPSSSNHVHHHLSKSLSSSTSSSSSPSQSVSTESTDPRFTLSPQPANVQSDILVQFCCRVKGSQPLGVAWYRNGVYIGGTIEKGKLKSDHHHHHNHNHHHSQSEEDDETEGEKSLLNLMKIDVNTKDFRTFKHFTDHILEIKSTRVDLSGTYSTCVYNHINQHWIDFQVTINAKNDYHQQQSQKHQSKSISNHHRPNHQQKIVSSPPPIKQRSTKSTVKNDFHSPKVLSEKLHSHHHGDEVDSSAPRPGTIAEREHKKWDESPVAWPDNPYTLENVTKRKQYLSSLESSVDKIEDDEANLHALPYISPSKDMGRYKRDYYVPNVLKEHETCNGVDEKVYSSSKYFSPSISPTNLSEDSGANVINHEVSPKLLPSSSSSSTLTQSLVPTVMVTSCSSTSSSPLPVSRSSGLSSSSSLSTSTTAPGLPRIVNEHHLHYKHAEAQVLENLGNITSLVSVKELINRFSDLRESNLSTNDRYLRGSTVNHNYGNSLNRDGTVINGGTGIKPRLITDKHHYEVPFKLSCWHDDEDNVELKDEPNDKIMNNNNHHHHHHHHHSNYHDENDNNVDQDNLPDYYERTDKSNCHQNNNNHDDDEHHYDLPDEDPSYGLDYYQRSNSEVSLPTLMSPPPPILPPRVQPRSTTNVNQANKPTSNRAKFNPVKPQHPLAVNSITGRCLNKELRNWANKTNQSNPSSSTSTNLMGSLSLYDINQASAAEISNPESPETQSPSNEGYISDDSNLSDRLAAGKQSTPFGGKKHVRRMAPSIMKRASFWEKKCEQET